MLLTDAICGIVVASRHQGVHSIRVLQHGDCSKIETLDLWLHVILNILSTALLGTTNYCMQCISAPTRHDIDKVHPQHVWMDLGISSVIDILRITWSRKLLWCLLFLSSIPIYLIYNSVISSSIFFSETEVFFVASNFPKETNSNKSIAALTPSLENSTDDSYTLNLFLSNQSAWQRTENKELN